MWLYSDDIHDITCSNMSNIISMIARVRYCRNNEHMCFIMCGLDSQHQEHIFVFSPLYSECCLTHRIFYRVGGCGPGIVCKWCDCELCE